MSHACNDPDCGHPEARLERLGGSSEPTDVVGALGMSLCGPASLNAVAAQYDAAIAKAAGVVDEMSKIRRIEESLFRSYLASYVEKANAAIKVGMANFPKRGDKPITRAQILKTLRAADRSFFRFWPPKRLYKASDDAMEESYKLSQ